MAVLRTGLSPVTVGRTDELKQLHAVLPGRAASPAVVLIGGEAGVGKSRLLSDLRAASAPATVLLGGAGQFGAGQPWSLLLDAVEPQVSSWDALPEHLRGRGDALSTLLAPVAPRLQPVDDRSFGPDELARAAIDLVGLLAPNPAAIMFEDLHAADAESLSLFHRLATQHRPPTLLVGTYRPEEVRQNHPLTALVADIERQRRVHQVMLARLARHEVAELLATVYGTSIPWHVVDAVHRRTGGNPFFVEELVLAAGRGDPERLLDLPLPWGLSEIVLRNLDDLTDEQRQVVDAAAVLGERFPFDVLAAVAGVDEDGLIATLRSLVGAGLVVESETDVFSFRHALTREAVVARLLGRQRRRIHEKALAVLEAIASRDYWALAIHAEGAGRFDQVVEYARQGALHYLRRGATHQALRLAEVGLCEDGDDRDLLRAACQAAWLLGLGDAALRHGEAWLEQAATAGDVEDQADAHRRLSRIAWETGDLAGQRDHAAAALALVEAAGPSHALAAAAALMSEVYLLGRFWGRAGADAETTVEWADRAMALADQLGLPDIRAAAMVNKGSVLLDVDRVEEGQALLEEATELAESAGDQFTQLRALNNLLNYAMHRWPVERLRATVDRIEALALSSGRDRVRSTMWAAHLAALGFMTGDAGTVEAALDAGAMADGNQPGQQGHSWDLHEAVGLAIEQGRLADADRLLQDAAAAGEPADPAHGAAIVGLHAQIDAVRGHPDAAMARLEAVRDVPQPHWLRSWIVVTLTTVLRHGGDPDRMRAFVDHAATLGWLGAEEEPLLRYLHAALAESREDGSVALAGFREVLAATSPPLRPAILVADAEAATARCLLALGQPHEARAAAERAAAHLARWPGWRANAAAALVRRTSQSGTSTGELTTREHEVAALVAEGLTNGQIAAKLYISTKTASVHVSNILAKLGMRSRAEVAAWVVRPRPARDPEETPTRR